MIELYEAALEAESFFHDDGRKFAIIGGLAVVRWGRPRSTQDVDFSVFVEPGDEVDLVDSILDRFDSRIPDAREFALANRILLVEAENGTPIDVAMASFPFEEMILDRATRFEFDEGVELTTVSAEDLVVLKAFARRPADWSDIEGIAIRQHRHLDWDSTLERIQLLEELTGESGISGQLIEIQEQVKSE